MLYDGREVFRYDGQTGVIVRDLDSQMPDLLFDPRTLGINALYVWDKTIQTALHLHAPQMKLIGQERIDGKGCWHVQMVEDSGWESDIWIDAEGGFAVYRMDEGSPTYAHRVTRSFYENPDYPWLPSRVEGEEYNLKGQSEWKRRISILAASKRTIPDKIWTLAGMLSGLPLLEWLPVTDVRTPDHSRLIGYWHKGRLGPPAPWEKAPDPPKLTPKRILLITIMALLVVAPAVAFAYRNRGRRASNII
jgi:hypothetical protein